MDIVEKEGFVYLPCRRGRRRSGIAAPIIIIIITTLGGSHTHTAAALRDKRVVISASHTPVLHFRALPTSLSFEAVKGGGIPSLAPFFSSSAQPK